MKPNPNNPNKKTKYFLMRVNDKDTLQVVTLAKRMGVSKSQAVRMVVDYVLAMATLPKKLTQA